MAKLKVGKGREGSSKTRKKKKVVEEITLSSGSEAEDSDHSESTSDVMEVDTEENNGTADSDCNGTAANEDEPGLDNDKPAENKTNDVKEDQKEPKEDTKDAESSVETEDNKNSEKAANGHQEPTENGSTDKKEGEPKPVIPQITKYVPPWHHPDLPDLKPRHVWSFQENQAIYKHLYPRVELPKLKHVQHYMQQQKEITTAEDLELDKLSHQLQSSNVIELANGVEAIIQPNGDTLVLPPDYKQKIEARRKLVLMWEEESTYTPPLQPVGRKLNITNVKFGRSVKVPKIVLKKILDVK